MSKIPFLIPALALFFVVACSEEPLVPPPVEVVTDVVRLLPYKPRASFVGRLQAEDDVKIQAKVGGYLIKRSFQEGDTIETGALLYEIDAAEYEATLARAKADIAKAKAGLAVAQRNFVRGEELLPQGAISAYEMDKLTAEKLQMDADLQAAYASLKSAEVDVAYTKIKAPISGRIGRSEISVGDLIGPESGVLTTLVSIDPMKVWFQIGEAAFLMSEQRRRNLHEEFQLPNVDVIIELSSKEVYPIRGALDYVSNRIDERTGTIEARASIANPDGALRPGQYVKVMIKMPDNIDTLMLPQAAVQADQQGRFVLAVTPDGTVKRYNVELGDRVDDLVLVRNGIEEGVQVIVRGLQKVRPGQKVMVKQVAAAVKES